MSRLMLFLLLGLATGRLAAADELVKIGGTVVNGLTGQKLAGAHVYLAGPRPNGKERVQTAKEDGRFEFLVPPGTYALSAETNSIYRQSFGGVQNGPVAVGVAIIAGPGQGYENLLMPLFPPASISGKVIDAQGDPVENALVHLMRRSPILGRPKTVLFRAVYSNDEGVFRFGLLPPGKYLLSVNGKPWYSQDRSARYSPSQRADTPQKSEPTDAYLPVYFPGTTNMATAGVIKLVPGQQAQANFALSPTKGANVRVECTGCPNSALLEIVQEGIEQVENTQQVTRIYSGHAVLNAVPPGQYEVRVRQIDSPAENVAVARVDVQKQDVSVSLTPASAPKVGGMVVMANGAPVPKGLLIGLTNQATMRRINNSVKPDGSFLVPGVAPGTYRLVLYGVKGIYAQSVRAGDQVAKQFQVPDAGLQKLQIVAQEGVGTVSGFVVEKERPVAGIQVVLAPEGLPDEPDRYRGFRTDSDGSFDIKEVQPGAYRLFVVPSYEFDLEYASPEAVRPYVEKARQVTVEPGGELKEKLDLVP